MQDICQNLFVVSVLLIGAFSFTDDKPRQGGRMEATMNNAISKDFGFGGLLRFAFPTIIMMIFMSLYTIVDGFFVARFVGTDALSAVNLTYPLAGLTMAIGIMFATGGSAVVSRQLGEGKPQEAKQNFTLIVCTATAIGFIITLLMLLFLEPLVILMGASGALIPLCQDYLWILTVFAPASVLQMLFQSFFVTAGKPVLGLALTIAAGLTNMLLDYVFVAAFGWGVQGAAWATVIGFCIPAVGGILFFLWNRKGLCFILPRLCWRILGESCFNGSSEMVTNISTSVTTFLFNILMMRYLGSDGVAAITVILYCQFLMTSLYLGFSMGVAPVIGFQYGSQNRAGLQRIFRICMLFIVLSSVLIFFLALLCAKPIAALFAAKNSAVYPLITRGLWLFSIGFLFAGVNIFVSALFTALSNGKISALLSFSRTFVFILLGLWLLPLWLQVDGIWLAIPFAELVTVAVSFFCICRQNRHYGLYERKTFFRQR